MAHSWSTASSSAVSNTLARSRISTSSCWNIKGRCGRSVVSVTSLFTSLGASFLPERRNCHRRPQDSTSVGLTHSNESMLHLSAIMTPACIQYRCLELRHDVDAEFLFHRFMPNDNQIAPPSEHDQLHRKPYWSHVVLIVKWSGYDISSQYHSSVPMTSPHAHVQQTLALTRFRRTRRSPKRLYRPLRNCNS